MFKESGSNIPLVEQKTTNGTIAERKVLGYQDNQGFSFLEKDELLKEQMVKIAEHILEKGGADFSPNFETASQNVPERTPGEKFKIALALAKERFFEVNFIKQITSSRTEVFAGRSKQKELRINALVKNKFSYRNAANQVKQIAMFNKNKDEQGYFEKQETPFTRRFKSSLKQRLNAKYPDVQIEYYPSIFESDSLKTHLDGIRGSDAFVIVSIPIQKDEKITLDRRVIFLDYTGNPEKIHDDAILKRGMGITKESDGALDPRDKKLRLYIEFSKVDDGANLAKMGDELAREIEKLV